MGSFLAKPLPALGYEQVSFNRLRYLALPLRFGFQRQYSLHDFRANFPHLQEVHFYFGHGRAFRVEETDELALSRPKG